MKQQINKSTLSRLLKGTLPGQAAQWRMAPETRRYSEADTVQCKQASVLVLIYPDNSEHCLLFIKRNEYDGPHSGQVSFPGGMNEPVDLDQSCTAKRETEEETGVTAEDIEILGLLTPLYIPVSHTCVQPVVGWLDHKPDFKPDSSEVQYLITPTLQSLIDPENQRKEQFQLREGSMMVPYFSVGKEKIWGATAMILSEFIELIGY